ncbi:hypothetical protein MP228_012987 [Amoeboaphelidium protococcarum]|nr:hypothetical protein MP228_012987 [Amoeboaphelidium protococcarum]
MLKRRNMTIQDCLEFLSTSYSPFHAVDNVKKRLLSANFQQLSEGGADWQLQAGKSYFVTRNQSSVIAFKIGSGFQINKDKCGSLGIVVAHTDSPCLKVKPRSRKVASGYGLVGVQTYGGGLWHTWFDRDLSMSGRVVVKSGADEKLLESRLVSFGNDAIMRIPTLAIHLDRTVKESFKFNDESQLQPILLNRVSQQNDGGKVNSDDDSSSDIRKSHHEALLSLITEKLQLKSMDQIVDFELCLHDTVPARLGGLKNEFIFSPRLDNLMMSYCAVEALLNSAGGDQSNECGISMVTLFDNEEVGSDSAYGANSNFLPSVLNRIVSSFAYSKDSSSVGSVESALSRCMASSLLISADMAHAIHPNYADKHEQNHQPVMNEGVTIKINANQRYATTSIGSSILKQIAQDYNQKIASNGSNNNKPLKLQEFVVRNDSPCGSTIGPILSTKMGIQTVDVGNAMLSMHSIRECCGAEDVQQAINLFTQVFKHGQQLGGYQVQNALN